MSTPESGNVMVVDALNLAFRWKHRGILDFCEDYIATVKSLAKSYKASKVIIACDKGSSSYRKALLPTYKSARKERFDNQTEAEKEESALFFAEFKNTIDVIEKDGIFTVLSFQGVEADDIAAHIVKHKDKYGFSTIILASTDADWDLLIQEKVMRFSYKTRKEISIDNWDEHYDYPQSRHTFIKCVMGDAGDSIPGVPQVGPARAKELSLMYEDIFDLASSVPIPGSKVWVQNLNKFGTDGLMLNYKLIDLLEFCDEAIGEDNIRQIEKQLT